MRWTKKGLIFSPDNNYDWMVSHASIPVADRINDDMLRIYFGTRDKKGRSHPTYIEVRANEPSDVTYVHYKPIIPLGKLGTFDDNGIMPSWIVDHKGLKYLYYIGWNPQVTVSYRVSIGLAVSKDGGQNFAKFSEGPICDRSIDEPYFNTAPCVLIDDGIWKMWYVSCTEWEVINGWPEPFYHIKYAESQDGVHWQKTGIVCIDYDDFAEAISRPCVYKDESLYKMLYSYRRVKDYRNDPIRSYRLGYAESVDGRSWIRKDSRIGIEQAAEGWDSEMMENCYVFANRDTKYLFYNGNGFGKSGFGYAILDES